MKNNILLVLLFFLIPILVNGQTQETTTSYGKKVILNADGTWKYAEEATTAEGKKVILNADGTWKYAEQKRASDIQNRTRNALENAKNSSTNSTSEGVTGGLGNQGVPSGSVDSNVYSPGGEIGNSGISYYLQGRGFRLLPAPRYKYQGEGTVVVEVSVDRSGKVTNAVPGGKGSTTLDEYLLTVAKEAAMKSTFEPKPSAPLIQTGTITYNFILK
jgi:colicin import membrane protein